MNYLLLFLFFCLSLGQTQRINVFDGQVNIYFHDIFLTSYVAYGLIKLFKSNKLVNFIKKDLFSFIPMAGVATLSLILGFWQYSLPENLVGLLYLLRLLVFFIFFGLLQKEKISVVDRLVVFSSSLVLVFSYFQYFLFPNFWPLYYLGWDPHMYRVVGTFFDATTAGAVFLFLTITNFFKYQKSKNNKYIYLAIAFVPLLFLTYSRITYLMGVTAIVYYLSTQKKFHLLLTGIMLIFGILFILPRPDGAGVRLERAFSIKSRIVTNDIGLKLFRQHPIFGVGFNRIKYAREDIGIETKGNAASGFPSSFVTALSSMGILGLLSFIYLIGSFWKRTAPEGKTLLSALIVGSFFENIFFVSFVFLFFSLCYSHIRAHNER